MSPNALHFGGGNIGRGFIGALLSKSGYHVTFADVVAPLIEAFNEHHEYDITILDVGGAADERITNVSGVFSNDAEAVKAAILETDIITTAVGPMILKRIAPTIAAGIKARKEAGKEYLNVIACENMTRASNFLKGYVLEALDSAEDKEYVEKYVGFPSCAVDRIVPPFSAGKNILGVGVEAFFEWIVEEPEFRGPAPKIEGMKLTDNLVAYVQRKLFTLNCGHAVTAYLGYLKGYKTVDESLKDPEIEETVRGAMRESGAALCKKHDFDVEAHNKYIEKIMDRFRNPYIKDDVARVGREPIRKLGPADRLVGPLKMASEYGLPVDNLLKGVAACLLYDNAEDPQAKEVMTKIKEKGVEDVVENVMELNKDHEKEVAKKVKTTYEELKAKYQK